MTYYYLDVGGVFGSDLSSRTTAVGVRRRIEERVKDGHEYHLCFRNVRSISSGFVDESLAVLVESYGTAWFRQHIRISNMSEVIRQIVLEAIAYRLGLKRLEN